MIFNQLSGGIGNQMFQYAFGKQIAKLSDQEQFIDESLLSKGIPPREYALHHFALKVKKPSKLPIVFYNSLFFKILRKIGIHTMFHSYLHETTFNYFPNIKKKYKNVVINGYWQSEYYFKDIKEEILKDFEIITPISTNASIVLEKIQSCNAVSLHVRRGDYVSIPSTSSFHGVCSLEYYHEAIKILNSKFSELQFFIFTDDIAWSKKYFNSSNMIIASNDNQTDIDDLRLMSYCQHHIIANSSFSWWGAYLGKNKNKTVIAPTRWFNNDSINTEFLIPKNWIRI